MYVWMRMLYRATLFLPFFWMKLSWRIGASKHSTISFPSYKENVFVQGLTHCLILVVFSSCSFVLTIIESLFLNIGVDSLGVEEMKTNLSSFQKLVFQLTGVSNVLEVMVSSFRETFSGPLHDLHHLLESTLKAKQVRILRLLVQKLLWNICFGCIYYNSLYSSCYLEHNKEESVAVSWFTRMDIEKK